MTTKTETAASTARRWGSQLTQLAAVVAIVLVGKGAVAEPFYVPSGSMEPTLLIGDALLASKYPYGYSAASLPIHVSVPESGRVFGSTPHRGDVVVFRWSGDRSQVWVKRVVGLPGDRVQLDNGRVFINGVAAKVTPDGVGRAEDDNGSYETAARYIETLPGGVAHPIFKLYDNGRLDNTAEVTVPPGHLFVMGDNRDNSADSRVPVSEGGVGLLPIDDLVGRVDAIVGSWNPGVRRQPVTDWFSGFRVARFFTAVH
ncbi:signal peptidase I [Rhodopseudomonas palustris]|uniref:Signal peptidase I n=1 Tax=Rhodopseudomonas palustris (strain ATCC BAA-98 / CGA009) TaxID=258594 RepID=Q6NBK4_RHOPA|nr:signal peptidase I [Rhodopseudomonas palustris]OPF97520.1 S26 family signal peptidase [Rhodopseudomonas palustris]PPQ41348.1 signal peptidase I [Rhodopseudomonas palustris]QLH70014.1 signal peptidase I [Rhodopseudomonas palustris]QQM02316.1 Signal peptidase I [Rhodopseudomonas palustris]RIA01829.1 signal peptidase I [Rhodopseudomonas palustris]